MTDFVFIRHGETDYNRQQRFQGHVDVPLNATGQAQAERLGLHLGGQAPQAFIASDLLRTRQTSAPLAARWGVQPALDAAFREQCFGVLEGLDVPAIQARHPDLWARWLEHRADFALPGGGESLQQFHARVIAAVRAAADAWPGQTVTVVTHGGVLDMLWRTAHGLPLDGLRNCEIPNTGVNRLRWRAGTLQIVQWADASHLDGLPEPVPTPAGEA
ncbi:MAG: histidine phosphatase family protein [Rubrivivax sp.]